VADRYQDWIKNRGLGHHTDVICVLDKGIVSTVASVPGFPGWGVIFLEGFGGPQGEGAHIGLGIQQLGGAALDGYFRLLLAHLMLFRGIVDHPGFKWSAHLPGGMMVVKYLTSITNEKDPEKQKKKLKEYADRAREEFSKTPVPADWPKE
jgi:hypothetical protein